LRSRFLGAASAFRLRRADFVSAIVLPLAGALRRHFGPEPSI
jgi:hypothetical protein